MCKTSDSIHLFYVFHISDKKWHVYFSQNATSSTVSSDGKPHLTIIQKMKTFLEVEGKMDPAPISQFRPPLPDTNPNIRKDNVTEKRKRAAPKRLRPPTPKPTTMCLPLPEAPPKPKNYVPDS